MKMLLWIIAGLPIALTGTILGNVSIVNKTEEFNMKENTSDHLEKATFGGGCFWCTEAVFSRVKGVESVVPGYAGGIWENPTYQQVISGRTGHAEVIQVVFDPNTISYVQLLEIFFRIHDPTTLNRQGADIGTQYRSIVLYHNLKQEETAKMVKSRLGEEAIWEAPIVTELKALEVFYEAEAYHHKYFEKNPNQAYCQMVILPKVEKFKNLFQDLLNTQ